jgi:hypothetical protein
VRDIVDLIPVEPLHAKAKIERRADHFHHAHASFDAIRVQCSDQVVSSKISQRSAVESESIVERSDRSCSDCTWNY